MVDFPLVVEPLGPVHDRASFNCGEPSLDAYIRRQASQDVRRRVAQTFVALGEEPQEIAGYYTLSAASFEKEEMPPEMAKKIAVLLEPETADLYGARIKPPDLAHPHGLSCATFELESIHATTRW